MAVVDIERLGGHIRSGVCLHLATLDRMAGLKRVAPGRWGRLPRLISDGHAEAEDYELEKQRMSKLIRRQDSEYALAVVPASVGALVVDVDVDKALSSDARVSQGDSHKAVVLESLRRLPAFEYRTVSGGWHLWYAVDGEAKGGAWRHGEDRKVKGDIRAGYDTLAILHHPEGTEPLDFLDLLVASFNDALFTEAPTQAQLLAGLSMRGERDVFGASAEDHCSAIKDIGEGNRNNYFNKVLFHKTMRGQWTEADIERFKRSAIDAGLSRSEVESTAESAMRAARTQAAEVNAASLAELGNEYPRRWEGRLFNYGLRNWILSNDSTTVCERHGEHIPDVVYSDIVSVVLSHKELGKSSGSQTRAISHLERRTIKHNENYGHIHIGGNRISYDADPDLIGMPDGAIYDMRRKALYSGESNHLVTRRVGTGLADKPSELWDQTVSSIFGNDADLIEYFARSLAYALSGHNHRHHLWFWVGEGSNGKSLLATTLSKVFGEYACRIQSRNVQKSNHPPHEAWKAELMGRRFATIEEIGGTLDIEALKELSGGSPIQASYKHKAHFEFSPVAKIHLLTNKPPRIPGGIDYGIERRVRVVPFGKQFVESPQGPDQLPIDLELGRKLQGQGAGILRWVVDRYPGTGGEFDLDSPEQVLASSKEYLEDNDRLRMFLEQEYETDKLSTCDYDVLKEDLRTFLKRKPDKGDITRLRKILIEDMGLSIRRRSAEGVAQWLVFGFRRRTEFATPYGAM